MPTNFANIQITFQILVQIPSCLASLATRKLGKTAILKLIQYTIHKCTDAELRAFINSALDAVANLMLQPLSLWKKRVPSSQMTSDWVSWSE
jgi:hypothetical protein